MIIITLIYFAGPMIFSCKPVTTVSVSESDIRYKRTENYEIPGTGGFSGCKRKQSEAILSLFCNLCFCDNNAFDLGIVLL